MRRLWNFFGTSLEPLWNLFGTSLELLWNFFGTSLKTSLELLWNFFRTMTKTILETCDIWDTDYNSDNWESEFMTIFATWQLRVTLDSIHNSCDVLDSIPPPLTPSPKNQKLKHRKNWECCPLSLLVSGNKDCQDFKFSNVRIVISVSNVTNLFDCSSSVFTKEGKKVDK